jgi:tetratricopeptide (TPR) repeat protein
MYFKYDKTGIDKAMAFYDSAMQHAKDVYDFSESELNLLGYQLLYGDRRVDDAVKVLELNAKLHPGSSNTFDSLGEAYLTKGDKASARKNYQRALEIDPGNINASNMLKKISP